MKVYHGTSYENGQKILKEGFNAKNSNWYVSNSSFVYFAYSFDEKKSKQMAIDNAQITAALNHSTSDKIMIFSIDVSNEELSNFKDYSCDNMSDKALEIPEDIVNKKEISYEIKENTFIPGLSLLYLFPLAHNEYLNTNNLSQQEYNVLKYSKSDSISELLCSMMREGDDIYDTL